MINKQKKLIEILLQSEKVVTGKELSYLIGVSPKTIRNYISAINSIESNCIISSNKGYVIDREIAQKIMNQKENSLPENQKERALFILKRLLQVNTKVDLNDLSDELLVSIETVKNDFIVVKEKVTANNLFIIQTNNLVWIEGSERDKRKLLSNLLSGEFNENLLKIEVLDKIFPDLDIKYLADQLELICQEFHCFINDYALNNLILEIAIEIDRMRNNFMYSERHRYFNHPISDQDLIIVKKLAANLEEKYYIKYRDRDINELANILLSGLIKFDFTKLTTQKLEENLDNRCQELILRLKAQMKNWGLFNVEDEGFLIKFSLHINNLLARIESGNILKNPLIKHIKHSCPLIFEHAIELGNTISKFIKKTLSEDEITFLALHIGSAIGENYYVNSRIKCILYVPSYYDYSLNLINKIKQEFEKDIVINQIITNIKEADITNNDLIISVGMYFYNISIPEVQIAPFMTKNDRNTLAEMIDRTKLQKERVFFEESLQQITESNLFYKSNNFLEKKDVLNFMCQQLIDNDYVSINFLNDVFEREKQSSTAFGKLAVPHSFKMDASKTCMSILISDKGIRWDENSVVHIVLLFAIRKNERGLFFNIFDNIVTKLLEPRNLEFVAKSETLDEAIGKFVLCV